MELLCRTTTRRLCVALARTHVLNAQALVCAARPRSTGTVGAQTHAASNSGQLVPAEGRSSSLSGWECAVRDFYAALGGISGPCADRSHQAGNAVALCDAHARAVVAMQSCLRDGRFQEAVDVHTAACRCGLSSLPWDERCAANSETAVLHVLALTAVRQLPYSVQHSKTMLYLLDAEDDQFLQTQHTLLDSRNTSAVEVFRITLQQRLQTLRTTGQLHRPLGHQYSLSAMREVMESPSLRAGIEPLPLVQLSSLALWHPFAYKSPTSQWARRQRHFDTFGSLRFTESRHTYSEQRHLTQISHSVSSIRSLCGSSALFLSTLARDWDAVFLRRVAETLVLPDAAHDVFPPAYGTARRAAGLGRGGVPDVHAGHSTWLDGSLFRDEDAADAVLAPSAAHPAMPYHPLQRLELIVKRRLHHDIIVPDPDFLFRNLQQLLQLSRHREVVVTHGVLLTMVDLACASEDPRRFHARRTLLSLLSLTSAAHGDTGTSPSEAIHTHASGQGRHSKGARRRWQPRCGFTILGLQDELALLEQCPERFFLGDHTHRGEAGFSAALAQLPGNPSTCRHGFDGAGVLSALLVAKQLQRVMTSHERGADFWRGAETPARESVDVDELIHGVLENEINREDSLNHTAPPPSRAPQPAPLFKQRSRAYWSRMPVVVATTSPATRSNAYSIGIEMYPPVVVN